MEEDLLNRLARHEEQCDFRYQRIEERLEEQKQSLSSLDVKIWGLAVLILVSPFINSFTT
jgi:butyrate kinase|tara:strand:+ start:13165 stop:13344 length:180 start_codon:yes stop_codon:yes gene_type:complete